MQKKSFITAIIALSLGVILLLNSGDFSEGVKSGLGLCSSAVIPSLFPLMALSVFICRSSASEFLSLAFKPLTKLFHIPACCGGILLCSAVGGYPAAAKCINDLVIAGSLDRKTASRLLCFCVNAGPPFLISVIGAGVFGNLSTGILLFGAQMVSSVLIAIFLSFFQKPSALKSSNEKKLFPSSAACLSDSIISAAESCFRMCAFILIACGISELAKEPLSASALQNPYCKAALYSFFEVTSGSFSCGNIPGSAGVIAAGAAVSFSGLSVILQIAAVTDESRIPLKPFLISRPVHAALTAALLKLFFLLPGTAAESFAFGSPQREVFLSASAPAAVSLLCMTSLFLLSLVPSKSETEPAFSGLKAKAVSVFKK